MKVTVFGSSYVGLVVAACFAETGSEVICLDIDEQKIQQLQQGKLPIYEPGLEVLVQREQAAGRLRFTTDVPMAVQHGDYHFIAVGTPPDERGEADLQYVLAVAEAIGKYSTKETLVINKSTVPIGTADSVRTVIQAALLARHQDISFEVVSNPEFLKEGAALQDFREPGRIIVGVESNAAEMKLRKLYAPFYEEDARSFIVMDVRSAELTKYAANALLATKISFMNEMANLAEKVGADIEKVREGIGADPRIGPHFIYAGCGYGGSCFGKDLQALINTAYHYQHPLTIIEAVEKVNHLQKNRLFEKIQAHFQGELKGKTFAVWGLAFKPETDDMRAAPSVTLLKSLWKAGAIAKVYDPKAMEEARTLWGERSDLVYCASPEEALENAAALVIVTEWEVFKQPHFGLLKEKLLNPVIFDGRNIYPPSLLTGMGITYYGIGRGREDKVFSGKKIPSKSESHRHDFADQERKIKAFKEAE